MTPKINPDDILPSKEQVSGSLLGLALADALGAPFEGMITIPPSGIDRLINEAHGPILRYTDDTEMAIGLCESLIQGFSAEGLAQNFAKNFDISRGYGRGTIAIIGLIKQGARWQDANRSVFPEGSFGNGAAMRAAPLGLMHHGDINALKQTSHTASSVTHAHPLAIEGATMIALATRMALRRTAPGKLLSTLMEHAIEPQYINKLYRIGELLASRPGPGKTARELGSSVAAVDSVPAALMAFLLHGGDYMATVRYAIEVGGDTDTIAAMAGAMAGAMGGIKAIPDPLIERLEHSGNLLRLAESLHDRISGRR